MEMRLLNDLKSWFEAYSSGFLGADDHVDFHVQIKRTHTLRTCREILCLAEKLSLNGNQRRIAEAVALLHDIGRFPQFAAYHTYNDSKSVDHCVLGIEVLRREGILNSLVAREKVWVETAVAHHGQNTIPDHIKGRALFFLKLIRDADKLDILRITTRCYRDCGRDNEILLDLPDLAQISPEVLDAALAKRPIEYGNLKTLNDFIICQIGWIYDMNFVAALERLESGKLLDEMFDHLPHSPDIDKLQSRIRSYIEARRRT